MTPTCQSATQQLALDTIHRRETGGIPTWMLNIMEWAHIDRLAGLPQGSYEQDPVPVYNAMQRAIGCCMVDQWIPRNPLTMGTAGYGAEAPRSATTGAEEVVLDGIRIDSPESVVEHLETHAIPATERACRDFDPTAHAAGILQRERDAQAALGPEILKVPYGCSAFPQLRYNHYGYENYFMAYIEYPELMERDFAAQAELARLRNAATVDTILAHDLPPMLRSDHDMADSRGTIVSIDSLDRLWFPHFAYSQQPIVDSPIKLLWHCDGNLMAMLPRLLEVGYDGFQGFQYEDGMDYAAICSMRTRAGETPIIIAGVSVTTTLPHGTPDDVRRELRQLVEQGPRTGLFLGASSSIAPGVPWANLQALVEGLRHYREHGRSRPA